MEETFPSHSPATGVNPEGWQTKMENLGPGAFPTLKNLTSNGEACGRDFLHIVGSVSCESSCGNMGAFRVRLDRADGCNKRVKDFLPLPCCLLPRSKSLPPKVVTCLAEEIAHQSSQPWWSMSTERAGRGPCGGDTGGSQSL